MEVAAPAVGVDHLGMGHLVTVAVLGDPGDLEAKRLAAACLVVSNGWICSSLSVSCWDDGSSSAVFYVDVSGLGYQFHFSNYGMLIGD